MSDSSTDILLHNVSKLAENLIRISRGAGKAAELEWQVAETFKAFKDYRAKHNHGIASWHLENELTSWRQEMPKTDDQELVEHYRSIMRDDIVLAASMKLVAEKMSKSQTRLWQAETEFHDAVKRRFEKN